MTQYPVEANEFNDTVPGDTFDESATVSTWGELQPQNRYTIDTESSLAGVSPIER